MYIKVINGVVERAGYTISELRKDNPGTSFPKNPSSAVLAEWGVFPLRPTAAPSIDYTKNIKEGVPVKEGDDWVQVWEVTDATLEEIEDRTRNQAVSVRSQRDQLLSASDWTQIADVPVDKTAWLNYRQELRNIPLQPKFPWLVDWPQEPVH
jgi:hypothetical protein